MYLYEIFKGLHRWYPTMQSLIQHITTDLSYDVIHGEKTECLASGALGGKNGQKFIYSENGIKPVCSARETS